jgi:aconitase A
MSHNLFNTRQKFTAGGGQEGTFYSLPQLEQEGIGNISRLPVSIRIVLESVLRNFDNGKTIDENNVRSLANWGANAERSDEVPFVIARVILQDFTGVPLLVDLAAMRSATEKLGKDPGMLEPLVPVDLVIDHSVQVDYAGSEQAYQKNMAKEFERNEQRYRFLKWGTQAFNGFKVVPPGIGIVHQVNLEYLARGVFEKDGVFYPDTLVGTDSHTTMINGLGIVGWGVGGIEAEAGMLGQPIYILTPDVIGVNLHGELPQGATATDLVLRVTEILREAKVVGKFVEFFGSGTASLPATDRATIANMSPEYGATMGFFGVDEKTLDYFRATGRSEERIATIKNYYEAQGMFGIPQTGEVDYTQVIDLDLKTIKPAVSGPKRPQDRIDLDEFKQKFNQLFSAPVAEGGFGRDASEFDREIGVTMNGHHTGDVSGGGEQSERSIPLPVYNDSSAIHTSVTTETEMANNRPTPDEVNAESITDDVVSVESIGHGDVLIAAITSCTNTSNPSVMLAAGILAKKAVERGMKVPRYVKTSLAPGSRVVTEYLEKTGLQEYLDQIGFDLVGYGCTTCIAAGTPVLQLDGTARPIEHLPLHGGERVFAPTEGGKLAVSEQTQLIAQGVRECVTLVLQDGRELVCTPDHKILCADGQWVRADELDLNKDRVVVGLEAPLDEPSKDEKNYELDAGGMKFRMDSSSERRRSLAFARIVGHLLNDGSISVLGQGRMHVGQAIDREAVLSDIELITGKRPAASPYDDRKWTIVLPKDLTEAIAALEGVGVGRQIDRANGLPAFVLEETCPVSVVREFLGGVFGADGWAPALHRQSSREEDAVLTKPAFSQSAKPEFVGDLRGKFERLLALLTRCGVKTEGAKIYEYPTRRSVTSYPAGRDGSPRIELRLQLADGLSFVECVGYRFCVDKTLRASAACVYWRTVGKIDEQRLSMSERLREMHLEEPALSFAKARNTAATELLEHETVVFPHYSLLNGVDRFSRLPEHTARKFQPLHRDSCGFPSPVELFRQLGVRDWFAPLRERGDETAKRYCTDKESLELPTFALEVIDRREAGKRVVFDISVEKQHAFIAGTFAVHNCIGNSGPLHPAIENAVVENDLVAASVLSGNRNFEARVHQNIKANFLMSPPLVVAYALAGTVNKDLTNEPLGVDRDGNDVYLKDIWASLDEVKEVMQAAFEPETYKRLYSDFAEQNPMWNEIPTTAGKVYEWDEGSTYIQEPPYFEGFTMDAGAFENIENARPLAIFGDSVTTDHISPAGAIKPDSPAGLYLQENGVKPNDFNSYGSRRGNDRVMLRGTFANVRIKNLLVAPKEGGFTKHQPSGEELSIYDAAMKYRDEGIPLIVVAGAEYGTGSSRDWAAKGTLLMGVRAVIATSFERIHRSNLIGMGVLPLQFKEGESAATLMLDGTETFDLTGLESVDVKPLQEVSLKIKRADGSVTETEVILRIDTPIEVEYYRHGGILQYVLRQIINAND